MGKFGSVIGLAFSLEGFAFFLEAIFLGIYLYGWDKLPKRIHWYCGFPIVLSGLASAWFVVTVNAWMNTPQGFLMEGGKVVAVEPLKVLFSPATWTQTIHMIFATYVVTGFSIASFYALLYLRGKVTPYYQRALWLSLLMGAFFTPLQIFQGDFLARMVAKTQPVKFAAMEGQFETQKGAPLRIGGIPNEITRETKFALEIPKLLSFLGYGDMDAEVKGLNDFSKDETPPVAVVHLAFQVMIGIGFFLLFLSGYSLYLFIRKKDRVFSKIFLWFVFLSGPLSIIAMEAGWVVTEVGRQPWIVQNVMRTSEAVTHSPGIFWTLIASILIYTFLFIATFVVLGILSRIPLPKEAHDS
jgi:cytochrome d ubiquinol oxidase subunit I